MLGVFSFHFCQSPIVLHGFGFCKYVYIGVSFFVSPLSFFKENHESNAEMKRPLLKWLIHIPVNMINHATTNELVWSVSFFRLPIVLQRKAHS